MAKDCSMELAKYNVAFVSIWPGAVRTETILQAEDKIDDPSVIVRCIIADSRISFKSFLQRCCEMNKNCFARDFLGNC